MKEIMLPDSSSIEKPHKIEGEMIGAKKSFYELAKSKIKYLSSEEFKKWQEEHNSEPNYTTNASYVAARTFSKDEKNNVLEKWIDNLEIVVDKDSFFENGKDYSDLIPSNVEHEIYEAWLYAKKGIGHDMDNSKRHILAVRKEYLMAEKDGLGEKRLEYDTLKDSGHSDDYISALEYAKRKLGKLKKS